MFDHVILIPQVFDNVLLKESYAVTAVVQAVPWTGEYYLWVSIRARCLVSDYHARKWTSLPVTKNLVDDRE